MISFPKINKIKKTLQYKIVEQFLMTPYWGENNKELFADDIEVEYPYAPPGMIQKMIPFEFHAHCMWLRKNTLQTAFMRSLSVQ